MGAIVGIASVLLVERSLITAADTSNKQQKLALQGQVADRFSAAIDHLGQEDEKNNNKLSIRLGGIYALQRLMVDSPSDEPAVVQVLCAFVRTHAPIPAKRPKTVPPSPADVRAAVAVLGARPHPRSNRLNFSNTLLGLDHADLTGADLSGADLSGANLRGAILIDAILVGTDLRGAHLRGADLTDADLTDAGLSGANLSDANLRGANPTDASGLDSAHLAPGVRVDE